MSRPRILTFDSGLGGLTVFREIAKLVPVADHFYAADDAGFPYGDWAADDLVWRVVAVMRRLVAEFDPQVVCIACNTASTLVLPHLRAAFPDLPFVGTVPAIKPAAGRSRSQMISVLATPGTVMRDYTRDLVQAFAAHCRVELVGSKNLARIAEDFMHGRPVSDEAIAAEIARCFVQDGARRTDEIVLACTHYPLLTAHFERLAPWPVEWIDPAPAIARRVEFVLREKAFEHTDERASDPQSTIVFTSGATPDPELSRVLAGFGLMAAKFAPISVENIRA
ncbi:MAG: glutamate racemase [Methylobacteriaceae bacterium]|nr:glutamate racemase [Methylobacteriaceae bacterium]MCC0002213.1 glutamate racemase [Methylobacteriaceae bacterium]HPG04647.1 glutamate racemase [Rhodoblastus sp.]